MSKRIKQTPLPQAEVQWPQQAEPVHKRVIVLAVLCYAWFVIAAWLAFAHDLRTDYEMAIVSVFSIIFFSLFLGGATHAADHRPKDRSTDGDPVVDTFTGRIPSREAAVEILTIPLALAAMATAFIVIAWSMP